jgi:cytochrome P450
MPHIYLPLILLLLGIVFIFKYLKAPSTRLRPLPPGPRGLPVIGNIHQTLGGKTPVEILKDQHQKYGAIVHLQIGQRSIVSLNSHEVAHELINKRNIIYGSRPRLVLGETLGSELMLPLMPNGERWRAHRLIATKLLNASNNYRPLQELESTQLLHELLVPHDFQKNLRRHSGSVMSSLIYGSRVEHADGDEMALAHYFVDNLNVGAKQAWLTLPELFPALNLLPRFLAPWERAAQSLRQKLDGFFSGNRQAAQARSTWSWTRQMEHMKESRDISTKEQAFLMGSLFAAGSESTSGVFMFFVLACVLNPESCRRAQAELDEVVGSERLPNFEDAPRLPYVAALISEVLRWRPAVPFGMPYEAQEHDQYKEYHISKGTTVIVNMWGVAFDEAVFPHAHEFIPERWLDNPDQPFSIFGYGRRVCPGKRLAQDSLFIVCSRILWAYNIGHVYKDGERVSVDPWDVTFKTTAQPAPIAASFTVRTPQHQRIIQIEWKHAEKDSYVVLDLIRREVEEKLSTPVTV